jgi:hypothetical protein
MAQSPKEQKPADKTPPPQQDTFGDEGTPSFEDTPSPTFQPQPPRHDKQGKTKNDKGRNEGGDVVALEATPLPDLKVTGMTVTPVGFSAGDTGVPSQAATLTVVVENLGTGTAENFRLDTWFNQPTAPNFGSIGNVSQTIVTLSANTSLTVNYSFTFAAASGSSLAWSIVDSGSVVSETNEVNNRSFVRYHAVEIGIVVPPSANVVGGGTVTIRAVATPYGVPWPPGCPTAVLSPTSAGTISNVVVNLQGDASVTFLPAQTSLVLQLSLLPVLQVLSQVW